MKLRVLTALVLIPPVVSAFAFSSPWPLYALAVLAALICSLEYRSFGAGRERAIPWLGLALAAASPFAAHSMPPSYAFGVLTVGWACGLTLAARDRFQLACLWFFAPLLALPYLHHLESPEGFSLAHSALLSLLPIWAGDTAAILVGKAIGRHKLAPSISPSKTWEGAIANVIACTLAAWAFGPVFKVGVIAAVSVGVICGVLGQAGDLFESWLKRKAQVKDSGTLLPGHGGLLDRIDSLLFSAIPACAAIYYLR